MRTGQGGAALGSDVMKLSVIMPVFNEAATVEECVRRVMAVPVEKELIIVDDGSTDGTKEILECVARMDPAIRLVRQVNRGKGAAVRIGFRHMTGDVVVIQDADLELDPQDYQKLLAPILAGKADVVYGSRFLERGRIPGTSLSLFLGNRLVTFLSNLFMGLCLTDMETCYKMLQVDTLKGLELEQDGFGFEPEITVKLAKRGYRIQEVPVLYAPRTYSQGKKIKWKDGFLTLWWIVKYALKS